MANINQPSSQVRVGVRIRPLTNNEKSQGGKSIVTSCAVNRTAEILNRKFTYDSVYDSNISQSEMYDYIGNGPDGMLEPFLDGYNSTIMAYGQTGSGKTFTMGSEAMRTTSMSSSSSTDLSSNATDDEFSQGLIPRFMRETFSSLEYMKQNSKSHKSDETDVDVNNRGQLIDYTVSASFLEIYSEEIYDLLSNDLHDSKHTLPIRDDANGGVVVVGLKEKVVKSAEDALQVLNVGTLNRTTARTLMNKTSSRSHAVFTIHLKQTIRELKGTKPNSECDNGGGQSQNLSDTSEFVDISTSSRFTFVDLAGSERLKKTGAEGERAKEGIKINEGLLALGNVINALGDEERLQRGEKVHVPYRQSKLTRLLQDALGGNSKTLFLACVSPSDTNASETVSTLKYANRARNIKNAPTKNIDASSAELQRLYSLTRILEKELVKLRFQDSPETDKNEEKNNDNSSVATECLLNREDVKKYLDEIYAKAKQNSLSSKHTSNIQRLQQPIVSRPSLGTINFSQFVVSTSPKSSIKTSTKDFQIKHTTDDHFEARKFDVNPDEDIALLDKILELQNLDQEYDKEDKQDRQKLHQVEGELEQQESLLLQLKDNLKVYHSMKERFEAMMIEVQSLESEKASIADELERVQLDPSKGCSKAIKMRLEKVEANLSRTRRDARKHQQMYRKAEQQAQKVCALQKKIETLKHGKVTLMKKQREASVKHKEMTDQKTREIMTLKKKERKDGHKLSKLESEVQKHKNHLQRRAEFCDKLSEKLKQTESHLMKVLSLRKRGLHQQRQNKAKNQGKIEGKEGENNVSNAFAPENEEVSSLKFLLEKIVSDRASVSLLNKQYEHKFAEYSDLMRNMVQEMKTLKEAKRVIKSSSNIEQGNEVQETISECNQNIEDLELKIEVVSNNLDSIRSRLPNVSESVEDDKSSRNQNQEKFENDAIKMIANLTGPVAKTLLWEILDITTNAEIEKTLARDKLKRKEAALQSFEQEIQSLNQQMEVLQKDLNQNSNLLKHDCDDVSSAGPSTIFSRTSELQQLEKVLSQLEQENTKTQQTLRKKNGSLSTLRERISVMEVTMKSKGEEVTNRVNNTLNEIQAILKETGISSKDREKYRFKIDSCLEDTCENILNNAKTEKNNVLDEIRSMYENLQAMYSALGRENDFMRIKELIQCSTSPYMLQLQSLTSEYHKILPSYTSAVDRISKISNDARSIIASMDMSLSTIFSDEFIQTIHLVQKWPRRRIPSEKNARSEQKETSRDMRAKKRRQVEELMRALESEENDHLSIVDTDIASINILHSEKYIVPGPNCLSDTHIDGCESELKKLKRIKSEALVSNQISRDEAKQLAQDMHLQGRELLSLCIHSVKRREKVLPKWWDAHVAEDACRAVVSRDCVISVSSSYTKHLNIIRESLDSISSGRKSLGDCLKSIIQCAHRTLLSTVEGDIDANEAYASFDKALSRLPKLSKEHICACLDEMKTLVAAVHDMSQSETEALTVVWQALNVTNNEKGQFWSDLNESAKIFQANKSDDFDSVKKACAEDIEEWVILAIKDSTKVNRMLNDHLLKLSKIHEEVERLRSKQDAKSQIMSLDSELCILCSKLAIFEEKAGNKQRLVTKKLNSSSLLQEERFRKQMQNNFSSKLYALVKLLNDWQFMEGKSFDEKMLSEDVNVFIKNPDQCGNWIEKRTAFMHLKTIQQKSRRNPPDASAPELNSGTKLRSQSSSSNNREKSRRDALQREKVANKRDPKLHNNTKGHQQSTPIQRTPHGFSIQKKQILRERNESSPQNRLDKTPTQRKFKKGMTVDTTATILEDDGSSPVLPFGQVLAKTPIQKENIRYEY